MPESLAATAFLMGAISAASLPLGALSTLFWTPSDRATAFLMAFGSGALLAALTIDLVASALNKGHFHPLALGCMGGGLLFIGLNEVVNNYGGFLRKASTTMYHMRRQDHRRYKRILSGLGRVDVFKELSLREFKALAASIRSRDVNKGSAVFRAGDPAEALYVVAEGSVELLDSPVDKRPAERCSANDAFGWMAFLTGAPHAMSAVAREETHIWVIPRHAFLHLLPNSSTLLQAVHRWLRSNEVLSYLVQRHGLAEDEARAWSDDSVRSLARHGTIPPAVLPTQRAEEFATAVRANEGPPMLQGLPEHELQEITTRLIYRWHGRGETFFHKGDVAEGLYVIDEGEVRLLDPADRWRHSETPRSHAAVGEMAFLTGGRHAVSAMAAEDTTVWVLRRQDFDELLGGMPGLVSHLHRYFQGEEVAAYLAQKQRFDTDKAARWVRLAVKSLDAGQPLPLARSMSFEIAEHSGAPLAIWLGILLDGIPESLVIGASLVQSHISLSLLAGLFLSNYPEALSSSVGMKEQGLSQGRILLMWASLVIITGVGAALGNMFYVGAGPTTFAFTEGIAAGAMLTMIAQTMLPEAYFKGGSIIGFSTLLGFLAAIFFTTLE